MTLSSCLELTRDGNRVGLGFKKFKAFRLKMFSTRIWDVKDTAKYEFLQVCFYLYTLLMGGGFLFVYNKRQIGWTNLAQIFFGPSHDPRESLWMIKIKKKPPTKFNCLKISKIRKLFLYLFFNVYEEKMLSIEIEDGRELHYTLSKTFFLIKDTNKTSFQISFFRENIL